MIIFHIYGSKDNFVIAKMKIFEITYQKQIFIIDMIQKYLNMS